MKECRECGHMNDEANSVCRKCFSFLEASFQRRPKPPLPEGKKRRDHEDTAIIAPAIIFTVVLGGVGTWLLTLTEGKVDPKFDQMMAGMLGSGPGAFIFGACLGGVSGVVKRSLKRGLVGALVTGLAAVTLAAMTAAALGMEAPATAKVSAAMGKTPPVTEVRLDMFCRFYLYIGYPFLIAFVLPASVKLADMFFVDRIMDEERFIRYFNWTLGGVYGVYVSLPVIFMVVFFLFFSWLPLWLFLPLFYPITFLHGAILAVCMYGGPKRINHAYYKYESQY